MSFSPPTVQGATSTLTSLTFDVAVSRDRVWRAWTTEIGAWWPEKLRAGGASSRLTLEARLDGRLIEEWGQGAGQTWYRVIAIDPGAMLDLVGHATPRFGGPTIAQLHVELSDASGGTRVSIQDGVVGPQRADLARPVNEGWSQAIGNALKKHVEAKR